MKSRKKTARIAGVLYLAYFIAFFLADNGVHYTGVESVDVAVVARNIMESEGLFLAGFVSFLLAAVFFLMAAWALYALLKSVNRDVALLFLLLNLGGVAVKCVSLLSEFAALLLLTGGDYGNAFQADQLQTLAMFFLTLYRHGFMIAQLFFGAWLLPLGYLVYKSGFLPKVLGILLIVDCVAILAWFFQHFLFPGYDVMTPIFLVASLIAEAALCLWLLVKGIKTQKPALVGIG